MKNDVDIGDVSTAFLQGDRDSPAERAVDLEHVPELRAKLGLTREQVLRLTGSVYGL